MARLSGNLRVRFVKGSPKTMLPTALVAQGNDNALCLTFVVILLETDLVAHTYEGTYI